LLRLLIHYIYMHTDTNTARAHRTDNICRRQKFVFSKMAKDKNFSYSIVPSGWCKCNHSSASHSESSGMFLQPLCNCL
jgi:hypothetical protein